MKTKLLHVVQVVRVPVQHYNGSFAKKNNNEKTFGIF